MNHLLFLNVGGSEVVIIALFVLLFFGSKSIPEFMRGLGKMTREFKDAMNGIEREVRTSINDMDQEIKKIEAPKAPEEKISESATIQAEPKKPAAADPSYGGDKLTN